MSHDSRLDATSRGSLSRCRFNNPVSVLSVISVVRIFFRPATAAPECSRLLEPRLDIGQLGGHRRGEVGLLRW